MGGFEESGSLFFGKKVLMGIWSFNCTKFFRVSGFDHPDILVFISLSVLIPYHYFIFLKPDKSEHRCPHV